MSTQRWLYTSDSKFSGIGIDLVTEQQVRALSEGGIATDLVSRGRIALPLVTNHQHPFPPTKFFSWLPSQDYYALNKRYFSWLGQRRLLKAKYSGVIAWSKTALTIFEEACRRDIPRILNVGNTHRDFDTGGSTPNERWPRIESQRYRDEYDMASLILLASDYAAHSFIAQGVPEAKLRVIYRGADTIRFHPLENKPIRPFIVACCGLLGERKGSYELLDVWRLLNLPQAELWFIGHVPDNERAALEQRALPSVRFLGFRKDIPELLRQAHLHVLLSRNEGFAKVILEAAASGVPNLCTYESGIPKEAPGTLFVADRGDQVAIAETIRRLYEDPEQSLALGGQAREMVESRFSWAQFRKRFLLAVTDAASQNSVVI